MWRNILLHEVPRKFFLVIRKRMIQNNLKILNTYYLDFTSYKYIKFEYLTTRECVTRCKMANPENSEPWNVECTFLNRWVYILESDLRSRFTFIRWYHIFFIFCNECFRIWWKYFLVYFHYVLGVRYRFHTKDVFCDIVWCHHMLISIHLKLTNSYATQL